MCFCLMMMQEQNPVPPSLREVEQRVTAEGKESTGLEEVMTSLLDESAKRCGPEVEDVRGGAASEILNLVDVSQSSVIVSSNADSFPFGEGSAHPGTHESPSNIPSPCLVDDVEVYHLTFLFSKSKELIRLI